MISYNLWRFEIERFGLTRIWVPKWEVLEQIAPLNIGSCSYAMISQSSHRLLYNFQSAHETLKATVNEEVVVKEQHRRRSTGLYGFACRRLKWLSRNEFINIHYRLPSLSGCIDIRGTVNNCSRWCVTPKIVASESCGYWDSWRLTRSLHLATFEFSICFSFRTSHYCEMRRPCRRLIVPLTARGRREISCSPRFPLSIKLNCV